MTTTDHGTHSDLHSEQGALRGEHPGRARNPVIKVLDLAWLEFEKPDLGGTEQFAQAFGLVPVSHTADELQLRGTDAGSPCVVVRRGARSKYARCGVPRRGRRRRDASGRRDREPRSRSCPRASAESRST